MDEALKLAKDALDAVEEALVKQRKKIGWPTVSNPFEDAIEEAMGQTSTAPPGAHRWLWGQNKRGGLNIVLGSVAVTADEFERQMAAIVVRMREWEAKQQGAATPTG